MKPAPVAPNLWVIEGEIVRWFTMPFGTRMTVIRLESGELFVHSPIRSTPELHDWLDGIGSVRFIVSPNKIHHLFMAEWVTARPDAQLYSPPGLADKRRDLAFEGELDDPGPFPWSPEIEQVVFRGSKVMTEVVFFHRSTKTLILGDLIENFEAGDLPFLHRQLARFAGILAPEGGTPRDLRMTFRDHSAAKRSADRILEWAPERVIIAHGSCIESDAPAFLRRAFSWATEVP